MTVPYFERRAPGAIIAGAFVLVLLPLLWLRDAPDFSAAAAYLMLFEASVLGTGHFFLTLALYLQSGHLDYFKSSWLRRVIFFGIPAAILIGVGALAVLPKSQSAFALYFFAALRFADFLHVGRQSYGMLQLFKRRSASVLPRWAGRAENLFFIALAILQWVTFAFGGRLPLSARPTQLAVGVLGCWAIVLAVVYLRAACVAPRGQRPWMAGLYFGMQAFASALAAYRTELYVIALALHYTEYHVIMAPRCFATKLDHTRRIDRVFGAVRARPVFFYALLIGVVVLFELRDRLDPGSALPVKFFVHIFDGIFLLHYFTEAFLWKFRDPQLGPMLAPLYFQPTPPAPSRIAAAPVVLRRPRRRVLFAASAAIALLALAWQPLGMSEALASNALIAPIRARNHRRWGIEHAQQGELPQAHYHLSEALRLQADDPEARRAHQWVQTRLRERATRLAD